MSRPAPGPAPCRRASRPTWGCSTARAGQAGRLAESLEAEKQQFPEGAPFMDFILKKFQPKPAEARQ